MKTFLKVLGIIVGVVVLIIVVAFVWLAKEFGAFSPSLQVIEEQAIRENNPRLCDKLPVAIPDTTPRQDCYLHVAVATKNTKICYEHPDVPGFPALDWCYQQIAEKYADVSVCNELRDLQKTRLTQYPDTGAYQIALINCYSGVAKTTGTAKTCEQISDNDTKMFCYMYLDGSTSALCEKFTATFAQQRCHQYFGD